MAWVYLIFRWGIKDLGESAPTLGRKG